MAERIVLLHSPSGAGKSSLVQAALIPRLRERDFYVRPVVRVSLEPPAGGNRYLRSTLLSLEEGAPPAEQLPLADMAGLSLDAYLGRRPPPAEADGEVLIFDQFEELLTADPTDVAEKRVFFEQLGAALRNRDRWALFAMREDYVAALDPYLLPIPTRLNTTYRLDLLGLEATRDVMRRPALAAGVAFDEAAAERLAADLSRVLVQRADGALEEHTGLTVEPVQLQVVCYRLWEHLPPGLERIGPAEVAGLGEVNSALADYYAEGVVRAALTGGTSERAVREWFDRQLITPQGIRGTALQGAGESQGLPNSAVRSLVDAYLVRGEKRRGATWLELAHDRLVEPVRAANAAWFAEHLSTLQRQADLWEQQGRPAGMLLRDALERERRQARRIRRLAIGAAALAAVTFVAFLAAGGFYLRSERERRLNRARELAAAAVSNLPVDPERSLLLASSAVDATAPPLPVAVDALWQAISASRLARTLAGHGAGLTALAFAPDGSSLATASNDGSARLWPAAGGEPLVIEVGPDLLDLAWSPGGWLATADLDGQVIAWGPDGAELWAAALDSAPNALSFSPDGMSLAVALDGGEVALLSSADGAELARLARPPADDGDPPPIGDVTFSADGARLLAGDAAGGVTLWEVADGESRALAAEHRSEVEAVAWSPDGATFATGDGLGALTVWDAASEEPIETLRSFAGGFAAVRYSADGLMLATAGLDGTAQLWSLATGGPLLRLAGHADYVTGVAFSPDGRYLATASLDRTARLWSLALLSPDGVSAADFSPDGRQLATGGVGSVRLWDRAGGEQQRALEAVDGVAVAALAYSPDGARLAAASDTAALVWDVATGAALARFDGHSGLVNRLAWSPDGTLIASVGDDYALRVWDAATGEERYGVDDHGYWAYGVAWSPDGAHIATCDLNGGLFVRDAAGGAALLSLTLPDQAECFTVVYSPDGARLATADSAGRAIVWGTATGDELLRVSHPPETRDVVFGPGGALLYTAGRDRHVRVWDAASGAERGALTLPAEVDAVRVSGDGAYAATVSADNVPRLFPLALDGLRALARERATRGPTAVRVLRIPAGLPRGGRPLVDRDGRVLLTNGSGYITGRGTIVPGDQLVALRPVTFNDSRLKPGKVSLYHDVGVPPVWRPLVNTLETLQYGRGYWINVTEGPPQPAGGAPADLAALRPSLGTAAATAAETLPPPPATFYGAVPRVGATAALTVEARVDGQVCATTRTVPLTATNQAAFVLQVPSAAEVEGCGARGKLVTFVVSDGRGPLLTAYRPWSNGRVQAVGFNTVYLPYVARGAAAGPDLEVLAVEVRPARPARGTPVEVRVTVRNAGTAAVGRSFWVDLYVNPEAPPAPASRGPSWASLGRPGASTGCARASQGAELAGAERPAQPDAELLELPGLSRGGSVHPVRAGGHVQPRGRGGAGRWRRRGGGRGQQPPRADHGRGAAVS
ncbi:MAG TPA: hypothetical protein PKD53_23275, partial [Chloroflexaceae bacterium]|nr:hypothetical protein [Chloroflexaceae bacterium]